VCPIPRGRWMTCKANWALPLSILLRVEL
jgi:hypothetical protein